MWCNVLKCISSPKIPRGNVSKNTSKIRILINYFKAQTPSINTQYHIHNLKTRTQEKHKSL